jgi:hypothetical protein
MKKHNFTSKEIAVLFDFFGRLNQIAHNPHRTFEEYNDFFEKNYRKIRVIYYEIFDEKKISREKINQISDLDNLFLEQFGADYIDKKYDAYIRNLTRILDQSN